MSPNRLVKTLGMLMATITYGYIAGRWNPGLWYSLGAGIPLGIVFHAFSDSPALRHARKGGR